MAVTLSKNVGRRSPNVDADVRKVQELLNANGAHPPLVVGKPPDETLFRAIEKFQSGFMKDPDGVVEPNGTTLRKLNATAPAGSTTGPFDVAIPIAFPDYLIQVDYQIPLWGKVGKMPYLGHAGVLIINGKTGLTKYYEYGRYPPSGTVGRVRRQSFSDVKIGTDGHPTKDSLQKVLAEISGKAGQNGKVDAAYIVLPGKFDAMLKYMQKREGQNSDPKRKPYELLSNSCMHFAKWTVEAGGATLPSGMVPSPGDWIEDVQDRFPDLTYTPTGKSATMTLGYTAKEKAVVPGWATEKGYFDSVWDGDE